MGKSKKNEKYVANRRMNLLGAFRPRKSLPNTRNGAKPRRAFDARLDQAKMRR